MIKIIATICMLIDHIGLVFFPDQIVFRIIGRMAFPLFAYEVAIGIERTKDCKRYRNRMILWAGISQLPYFLMSNLHHPSRGLNILVTFSIALFLLMPYKRNEKVIFWNLLVPVILLAEIMSTDYGAYGVLTVVIFYVFKNKIGQRNLMFIILTATFTIYQLYITGNMVVLIYLFHISALFVIYTMERYKDQTRLPRYFFYIVYPAHMMLLWAVAKMIEI